jgi:hypothetical protein
VSAFDGSPQRCKYLRPNDSRGAGRQAGRTGEAVGSGEAREATRGQADRPMQPARLTNLQAMVLAAASRAMRVAGNYLGEGDELRIALLSFAGLVDLRLGRARLLLHRGGQPAPRQTQEGNPSSRRYLEAVPRSDQAEALEAH